MQMSIFERFVVIKIPESLVLDLTEIAQYFKDDVSFCSVRQYGNIIENTISGTIKDKEIFDYLVARFDNPVKSFYW